MQLQEQIKQIAKGNTSMGVALWCTKGGHAFDEDDENAERMTVDKRDPETGKKTGQERTVYVCGYHARELFEPQKKSLSAIVEEINGAEEIGE